MHLEPADRASEMTLFSSFTVPDQNGPPNPAERLFMAVYTLICTRGPTVQLEHLG